MAFNWLDNTPCLNRITAVSASVCIKIDTSGNASGIVLPYGSSMPSPSQIKAGLDALNVPVPTGMFSSKALIAGTMDYLIFMNLKENLDYQVFITVES